MMNGMLMMIWVMMSVAYGQIIPPCADQLWPCINSINSTNPPPDTCCNPVKEIDATQKTCFCELGFNPAILQGLGVTTVQAVQLLHLCGVNFNINTCKASSALPPSLMQPPATPGSDEGGACRVTIIGLSFMLFLCAHALFN